MADEEVQAPAPEEETTVLAVEPAVEPKVSEGVHYVYNGIHVGASILEVHEDGSVRLHSLGGGFSASPIFFDANGAEGTWHYPEE